MSCASLWNQLMPEAVLGLTALLVLGVAMVRGARPGAVVEYAPLSWLATLGLLVAAACVGLQSVSQVTDSLLLSLDPLALLLKGVVLGLGLIALWLPPAREEIREPGEYLCVLLFGIAGLSVAVATRHLLMLFVALELASLSLYLLAGFARTRRGSEVALKYFLFGGVSAAFMLFGISLIYGFCGSLALDAIATTIAAGGPTGLAMAGLVMMLVGVAFKLAAAPFHYWAPDVYQGAPATSVALISAASKVVGLVVLARICLSGFGALAGSAAWGSIEPGWAVWVGILAAVSMILGNVLALAQTSVRRLLAYSAVANTGYLLVGVAAHGNQSAGTALFYVVVYGLATLGALAVTAAVERQAGDDSRQSFAGLVHRSPGQAVALLICFASLAGIPPLAGFVGKFALFGKAMAEGGTGMLWLVLLGSVLSAVSFYYYLRVLKQAFVRPDESDIPAESLAFGHRLAILLPAAGLVVLGLCPALLMDPMVQAAAQSLAGR